MPPEWEPPAAIVGSGRQSIPRPPVVRPGPAPVWSPLAASERRFRLVDVDTALARLSGPHPSPWALPDARPSAVLLPVYEDGGELHLILTKRPDTMRRHRGEISFPGGRYDANLDRSLADTARRETEEEIGIPADAVRLVGELDTMATFVSGFTIAPFVGALAAAPELRLQPSEVEAAIHLPVSALLAEGVYHAEIWDIHGAPGMPDMVDRRMHFFEVAGQTVWGATGRILTMFLEALVAART